MAVEIADPRTFPQQGDAAFSPQLELAAASLEATGTVRAAELDQTLTDDLARALRSGDASWLVRLFAAAPSAAIGRHLWRRLLAAWKLASRNDGEHGIAVTLFALPIVIVAARRSEAGPAAIDAVLPGSDRVAALLQEHGALAGNRNFGLGNALVAAEMLDLPQLPELLSWTRLPDPRAATRALSPAPIPIAAAGEGVHLRFLFGTAVAAPGADLLADAQVGAWGIALAQELARQLAAPEISLLALPRAPRAPPTGLHEGRAAQREVGAHLFTSNAIRRLRAAVGEPSAVVSAHRSPTAAGGGELRLSISSAFDAAQAEGFRCPLFIGERAGDVAAMLVDLLRACRVADVHVLPGVYPDRDAETGLVLLFKPESLPQARNTAIQ